MQFSIHLGASSRRRVRATADHRLEERIVCDKPGVFACKHKSVPR
jgi:hypothetical protein